MTTNTADTEMFSRSGQILAAVHRYVFGLPVRGRRVLDVCEMVEARIRELGALPAFPCNVGINEVAAHYTSPVGDRSMIPDGSIVKIDFGAEVDGFITDTAVTLSLSPAYDAMVVAVEAALKEAIAAVTPGRRISEVGGIIERCVRSYGYKPIKDLSGHKIERYRIHADKTVPNVSGFGRDRFEVGEVYAIEPFLTLKRASGTIRALKDSYIYRFMTVKGAPTGDAEKLADYIQNTYRGLPFTPRWLVERFGEETITETFKELVRRKCVVGYPVLVEASGSVVAQAEHTILVTEAGCRTLT